MPQSEIERKHADSLAAGMAPIRAKATTGEGTVAGPPAYEALLHLQRTAGNQAVTSIVQRDSAKGMLEYAGEWVKDKLKGEGSLDKDLVTGLRRTANVFSTAREAVTLGGMTDQSLEYARVFGETATKFAEAAENGEKIVKVKEYLELFIEFKKSLAEAEGVDLAKDGPEGAKKLFALMAAGGKIGAKVFPPPFNQYFNFVAQIKNLENVAASERHFGAEGELLRDNPDVAMDPDKDPYVPGSLSGPAPKREVTWRTLLDDLARAREEIATALSGP